MRYRSSPIITRIIRRSRTAKNGLVLLIMVPDVRVATAPEKVSGPVNRQDRFW